MNENPGLPVWKKLFFSATAVIFFLAVCEGLLMLSGFRYDTRFRSFRFDGAAVETARQRDSMLMLSGELFWELRPGGRIDWDAVERINAKGFRGKIIEREKKDGVFRIICVGDSCMLGAGVPVEESLPEQIAAAKLKAFAGENTIEVLNAGVRGYSVFQIKKFYQNRLSGYRPDLVVIYPGAWNDYAPAIGEGDIERFKKLSEERKGNPILNIFRSFRSYQAMVRIQDIIVTRIWEQAKTDYREAALKNKPLDGRRVEPAEFEICLKELTTSVAADGASAILIVPPLPAETLKSFPASLIYREIIRGHAEKENIPLLDSPVLFEGIQDAELFTDWIHPNGKAFSVMAEEVINIINSEGMMDEER